MTTWKAIVLGFALIAAAILLTDRAPTAEGLDARASNGAQAYALSASGGTTVWRIRLDTGQVSFCDRGGIWGGGGESPQCSPWSQP